MSETGVLAVNRPRIKHSYTALTILWLLKERYMKEHGNVPLPSPYTHGCLYATTGVFHADHSHHGILYIAKLQRMEALVCGAGLEQLFVSAVSFDGAVFEY